MSITPSHNKLPCADWCGQIYVCTPCCAAARRWRSGAALAAGPAHAPAAARPPVHSVPLQLTRGGRQHWHAADGRARRAHPVGPHQPRARDEGAHAVRQVRRRDAQQEGQEQELAQGAWASHARAPGTAERGADRLCNRAICTTTARATRCGRSSSRTPCSSSTTARCCPCRAHASSPASSATRARPSSARRPLRRRPAHTLTPTSCPSPLSLVARSLIHVLFTPPTITSV